MALMGYDVQDLLAQAYEQNHDWDFSDTSPRTYRQIHGMSESDSSDLEVESASDSSGASTTGSSTGSIQQQYDIFDCADPTSTTKNKLPTWMGLSALRLP